MNPSAMNHYSGNLGDFGMDTISLAGPLQAKLQAVRAAGFGQLLLAASDLQRSSTTGQGR